MRWMGASLQRWRYPVVESHGDYEADSFLELPIAPLYRHQADLPQLPVPSLQDTVDRFLPTALPLAETIDEEESLRQACCDFPRQAQHLQERLLQKAVDAEKSSTSWLQQWWITLGYLQYRDPVVVNVSYFFNLPDDPTLNPTHAQVQRGAAVMKAAWEYRQQVCSGTLPQETIGKNKTPLCSVGFKYLFHSCRIAKDVQDSYKIYDPSIYTHAVVACRGHFFALPLVDEHGQVFSLSALEAALAECLILSSQRIPTLELGLLTTSHRDKCAVARDALLCIPGMDQALELLESGMLLLCLDDETPYSKRQRAQHYWHGNGSSNRWYDKNVQLIVPKNGTLGYVGEHAMMDGMPALGFCRHMTGRTYQEWCENNTSSSGTPVVQNIFEPILKNLDTRSLQTLEGLVDDARSDFQHLVGSNDMEVLSFQGYGTTFIKASGYSPDAFVQMAIQVATFRLFGKQAATYESTQVRPFLHGRTETTRTVSLASSNFCHAMGLRPKRDSHDSIARTQKLTFLKEATESHVKYSRLASQAQGVDRHLLGLGLVAKDGEELPDLLSHPLHVRSKTWRVSTSALPGVAPGFGPVCDTGVGIGYDVRTSSCVFTVSSLKHHNWTEALCYYLEEALLEMKELVDFDGHSRSKL
jgi:carnitine O-acetyltransferase